MFFGGCLCAVGAALSQRKNAEICADGDGDLFLCTVLLPAGRMLKNISLGSGELLQTVSVPEELSSRVAEQSCSVAQQSIQNLIRGLLARHGVVPKRISVTVETDDSGTIQVCGAFIWLSADDLAKEQQIRTWVDEELGLAVECRSAE